MGAPVVIRRRATAINRGVYTLDECLNTTELIGRADGSVVSSIGSVENWCVTIRRSSAYKRASERLCVVTRIYPPASPERP
jgi:hypothetical protein